MPIAREGRFLRWPDMQPAPGLGLESSRLDECVEQINREQITGVFGSPAFNFYESDLDVLARIPHVEAVWFWDVELKKIDGLYALSALTKFGVHPKRPAVDFSRLPKLKQLVWHHKRQDHGVHDLLALESLHSWRYRDATKTFHNLALPPNLVRLEINWSNCETLDGLPTLPRLRRLEIHRCRNLRSLGRLPDLFPELEYLLIAACGRVENDEGPRVVRQLPNLWHAYVKDRLLITRTARHGSQ
ncbi:MAG TPA: hypothetical protein VHB79_33585 [Polyangiaceae bacterium]|nr:hypothetical protein [Polyangiaceae bacterium]